MRVRWRRNEVASQDDSATKLQAAEESLRQAETALERVQEQKKVGTVIAETLAAIRAENHFKEMWNEGIRGG